MKSKSIYLSNFKYKQINNQDNYNNLVIENIQNVNLSQGIIQSLFSECDIIDILFNQERASIIKNLNNNCLNSFIRYIPYEYFDDNLNEIKLRLFALSSNNNLYKLNNDSNIFEIQYSFNTIPKIILSKNTLYFFDSNDKCILVENENLISIENIPQIKSFASTITNLFFVLENQPHKLFIAEDCELKNISTNTEQYTQIAIPIEDGLIEGVFYLKGKVYIFSKYAIFKLDQENNYLIKQNKLNLSISKNSIKQIDDSIYFYSSNGFYCFDGMDIRQVFDNYLNLSKNAIFEYFNQNLYILDANYQEIIFKYDLTSEEFSKLKLKNLHNFYQIKNESNYYLALCKQTENNYSSSIIDFNNLNNTVNQVVKFKPISFNNSSLKNLSNLFTISNGDFQLKISSEFSSTTINISNETKSFKIDLTGTYFIFEINANSKFRLESIIINFSEVGE